MLVRELMSSDIVSVRADASLKDAARLLVEHRISGLPVVDESGQLVGVVSEADFVKTTDQAGSIRSLFARFFIAQDESPGAQAASVRSVMSAPPKTIAPDQPMALAAAQMGRWKVNRLPVVEDGQLVGIITRADIVRVFARSDLELLEDARRVLESFDGVQISHVVDGVAKLDGEVSHKAIAEGARSAVAQVAGIIQVDDSDLHWARGFGSD